MGWSISVKTVGVGDKSTVNAASSSSKTSNNGENTALNGNHGNTPLEDQKLSASATPPNQLKKDLQSTFTIEVEPDSPLSSLHSSIEEVTGISASHQRLIYRGRLINAPPPSSTGPLDLANASPAESLSSTWRRSSGDDNGNIDPSLSSGDRTATTTNSTNSISPKEGGKSFEGTRIRDVDGLADGQTIHLVPRRQALATPSSHHPSPMFASGIQTGADGGSNGSIGDGEGGDGSSTTSTAASSAATASLLATLLGLGASSVTPVVVREQPGSTPQQRRRREGETGSDGDNSTNADEREAGNESGNDDVDAAAAAAVASSMIPSLLRRAGDGGEDGGSSPSISQTAATRRGSSSPSPSRGRSIQEIYTPVLRRASLLSSRRGVGRSSGTINPGAGGGSGLTVTRSRPTYGGSAPTGSGSGSSRNGQHGPVPPLPAGSLEPVRQGLMTLHTMMAQREPEQEDFAVSGGQQDSFSSALDARRKFYRGQWVDVKDTVNQWIEATVLEIANVDDVVRLSASDGVSVPSPSVSSVGVSGEIGSLGRSRSESGEERHALSRAERIREGRRWRTEDWPIVSGTDLEGRAGLFHDDEVNAFRNGGSCFPTEPPVQLLLIHYNGWPHRWDEWIRSDSVRVRPFRTRTRHTYQHPSSSSVHGGAGASPVIQSIYADSPSTSIRSDDTEEDRHAVLPELYRVVDLVQQVLSDAAGIDNGSMVQSNGREHLQNVDTEPSSSSEEGKVGHQFDERLEADTPSHAPDGVASSHMAESWRQNLPWATGLDANCQERRQYNRESLVMLAPLLDRLGRTLTDAAPHVAALAASVPQMDGFQRQDQSTAVVRESPYEEGSSATRSEDGSGSIDESDGVFVFMAGGAEGPYDNEDHIDYVNAMVNTSRGRTSDRNGRRGRRSGQSIGGGSGSGSRGGSILASYLAATGLAGRGMSLLGSDDGLDSESTSGGRESGGESGGETGLPPSALARLIGGGNIDIHIHAVVTPGFGPGGVAFATLPTATPVTPQTQSQSPSVNNDAGSGEQARRPTPVMNDDDLGLFDELYSGSRHHDTPAPIVSVVPGESDIISDDIDGVREAVPVNTIPPLLDDSSNDDVVSISVDESALDISGVVEGENSFVLDSMNDTTGGDNGGCTSDDDMPSLLAEADDVEDGSFQTTVLGDSADESMQPVSSSEDATPSAMETWSGDGCNDGSGLEIAAQDNSVDAFASVPSSPGGHSRESGTSSFAAAASYHDKDEGSATSSGLDLSDVNDSAPSSSQDGSPGRSRNRRGMSRLMKSLRRSFRRTN